MKKIIFSLMLLVLHISPLYAATSTTLVVSQYDEGLISYRLSGDTSASFTLTNQAHKLLSFTLPHAGCYTYTLSSSSGQTYRIVIVCNQKAQTQSFVYNAKGEKTNALSFGQRVQQKHTPDYQAPADKVEKEEKSQKEKTMRTPQTKKTVSVQKDEKEHDHTVVSQKTVATGDTTKIAIYVLLFGLSFICIRKWRGSL